MLMVPRFRSFSRTTAWSLISSAAFAAGKWRAALSRTGAVFLVLGSLSYLRWNLRFLKMKKRLELARLHC